MLCPQPQRHFPDTPSTSVSILSLDRGRSGVELSFFLTLGLSGPMSRPLHTTGVGPFCIPPEHRAVCVQELRLPAMISGPLG